VFALKWYGKNVKRRTNGFAKERVLTGEAKTCIYCDVKLTEKNATAEHVVPISQGGSNSKINLLVCYKQCNNDRGDDDFNEYLISKKPYLKGLKIYL
jgi:5-methylcytosine-specific restriction endonuclease McrA